MTGIPAHDDRGHRVVLSAPSVLAAVRFWRASLPRLTRRRLVRLVGTMLLSTEFWLGLAATGWIIIVSMLMTQNAAVGLGLMVTSPVIMPMVAFLMVLARGLLGLGGRFPAWIIDRLLAAGRCPRCRYEIDQVPAEGDGCAVCPECGAAWQWTAIGDRLGTEPEVIVLK